MNTEIQRVEINQLTDQIIGAAIEVHRALGPGLLESAYEECLCHELFLRKLDFERQVSVPVIYKNAKLDCGYRLDTVVKKRVLLELKAVDFLSPIFEAQVLTYLRLTGLSVGLLINFNVPVLKSGIKRIANNF
ncbi:MAG TPA: GxxExxY protein [Thermoflexales bacterium]|nr:GxxExxY protein [Thermoflexales bacterium]HQW34584.1 GxxExxY protein [Thermoflexales bacterium]HQZ21199.1 GxxExxY protein [Thermoflexales bacterium]